MQTRRMNSNLWKAIEFRDLLNRRRHVILNSLTTEIWNSHPIQFNWFLYYRNLSSFYVNSLIHGIGFSFIYFLERECVWLQIKNFSKGAKRKLKKRSLLGFIEREIERRRFGIWVWWVLSMIPPQFLLFFIY